MKYQLAQETGFEVVVPREGVAGKEDMRFGGGSLPMSRHFGADNHKVNGYSVVKYAALLQAEFGVVAEK